LPSGENAVDNRSYRSQSSKNDDQLIVNRHRPPFFPEGTVFPGTAVIAGIACIGVGCYWLVLGACFGFRRGDLAAAIACVTFRLSPFNIRTLPVRRLNIFRIA
jgi:hypothetical protein